MDNFDVGVVGERAPVSVGLDGFVGVGSADDGAAYELSAAGRNASLNTLHDGEVVASWIEGDTVKAKILVPSFNAATGTYEWPDASAPRHGQARRSRPRGHCRRRRDRDGCCRRSRNRRRRTHP